VQVHLPRPMACDAAFPASTEGTERI
jgi:hypothetical protein